MFTTHVIDEIIKLNKRHSLAIGFFDGVHLGHKEIISKLVLHSKKNNTTPTVITFSHSPKQILKANSTLKFITPYSTKLDILKSLGVECVITLPFNEEFSKIHREVFLTDYLLKLNIDSIFIGKDFKFGKGGAGDVLFLKKYVSEQHLNIKIYDLDFITNKNEKISTRKIIGLITSGDIEVANSLLGHTYSTTGLVTTGLKLGRKIGFRTANLKLNDFSILPKNGVYAVKVLINNQIYLGMGNVGVAPTLKPTSTQAIAEVHILDFDKDIYGETIEVFWYKKIRDEVKFPDKEALISKLNSDKKNISKFFANFK